MIKTVIRLRSNMVMVFNSHGEQIPAYQGQYEDVRAKIIRAAPTGTMFNHWFGNNPEPETVTKEIW